MTVTLDEIREMARAEVRGDVDYFRATLLTGDRQTVRSFTMVDLLVERHRADICMSQMADLFRALSKDQRMNPRARAPPSKAQEQLAFGHAFLCLVAWAEARGIDIEVGAAEAAQAWSGREFEKKVAKDPAKVQGKVVVPISPVHGERIRGVVCSKEDLATGRVTPSLSILVADHINDKETELLHPNLWGVVLDHGSELPHAATICRERNIPLIVGTGNATTLLKAGMAATMYADGRVEAKP